MSRCSSACAGCPACAARRWSPLRLEQGPEGDRVFTILEKPAPSYSLQYDAMTLTADPQYFSVMQIPLLRGRVFTEHERLDNDHYIVVSKQFADQFFSGDDPIGKHVRVDWDDQCGNLRDHR